MQGKLCSWSWINPWNPASHSSYLRSDRCGGLAYFSLCPGSQQERRRLVEVKGMTTMDRDVPEEMTLKSAHHIRARTAGARIITDDNMGTEWQR
jgi:hypothetical protein